MEVQFKEVAGHARNRSLSTDIDELAARGLGAGANLDVAVREPRLDEVHVAELVPNSRVVLDARRPGLPGRTQQRGRGQEPRAQRQHPPPTRRRRGGVARRGGGRGRRGGGGAAGRDGERPSAGLGELRRRDWAGRHAGQGGDGRRHGLLL